MPEAYLADRMPIAESRAAVHAAAPESNRSNRWHARNVTRSTIGWKIWLMVWGHLRDRLVGSRLALAAAGARRPIGSSALESPCFVGNLVPRVPPNGVPWLCGRVGLRAGNSRCATVTGRSILVDRPEECRRTASGRSRRFGRPTSFASQIAASSDRTVPGPARRPQSRESHQECQLTIRKR